MGGKKKSNVLKNERCLLFIYLAADEFKNFIYENFPREYPKCINLVQSKVVGKINFKQKSFLIECFYFFKLLALL